MNTIQAPFRIVENCVNGRVEYLLYYSGAGNDTHIKTYYSYEDAVNNHRKDFSSQATAELCNSLLAIAVAAVIVYGILHVFFSFSF